VDVKNLDLDLSEFDLRRVSALICDMPDANQTRPPMGGTRPAACSVPSVWRHSVSRSVRLGGLGDCVSFPRSSHRSIGGWWGVDSGLINT